MVRKNKEHDETPAIISDHSFEPRREWWSLCRHCNLAMAAHAETKIDARDYLAPRVAIEYYGDDEDE